MHAHPSPILILQAHRHYTSSVLPLHLDSSPTLSSWNQGIPCPKSFKLATRYYTIFFPRPVFLRVDCATVYATPGPRGGQGAAICRGTNKASMCVLHGAELGLESEKRREGRQLSLHCHIPETRKNLKNSYSNLFQVI